MGGEEGSAKPESTIWPEKEQADFVIIKGSFTPLAEGWRGSVRQLRGLRWPAGGGGKPKESDSKGEVYQLLIMVLLGRPVARDTDGWEGWGAANVP